MKPLNLKHTKLMIFAAFLHCFAAYPGWSQAPKAEFRAVWVATVANIDWPSRPGLPEEVQKAEVIRILDRHKENGMNAIILQVRPMSDAIYYSHLEPWSHYLTGEQGVAPDGFYDPLAFWVEETHRRGMELHAWFNPYRVKQQNSLTLAGRHVANQFPDWVFEYGGKTYFSPAIPGVRQFVNEVVADVVARYDIDAVHFDDYFYPYQVAGEEIPDSAWFSLYGGDYFPADLAGWRRHNVDIMIRELSATIKSVKPWVKFGISPFGVWRNRTEDPFGSETRAGTTNYDGLYADVLLWQREGWIDYLMPQIYWRDDHPVADFSTLAYWWNDMSYGRHLYVGLGTYRLDRKSDHRQWRRIRYLENQIDILRELQGIDGYGMFSSKHFFRDDLKRLNRRLGRKSNASPALIPSMPWLYKGTPPAPTGLVCKGNQISWDESEVSADQIGAVKFFVLYRFGRGEKTTLKRREAIVEITGENFVEFDGRIPAGTYRATALDRLNNESPLSDPIVIE